MSLRPSNAGRWVPCPASPALEAPYPDDESEDAREGTAAHWVAAQVLGGHHALDELTDRATPNGVIVTGEMVEHVQTYIDTVGPGAVIERELPSAIPGVDPGTPDALRIEGNRGHIWDFKYGYNIVGAVGNWQGACYAVNLFAKHEWMLEEVTFTVVQPRPFHYEGRVRSWTITRDWAWLLYTQLTAASAATDNPTAPAVTGPHCSYCRALHVCESARRAGMNGVDVSLRQQSATVEGEELAGELRTLRRARDAITKRLDALESHAMSVIDSGRVVPGWSIDRAFGRRKWTGDVATLEALTGVKLREERPVSPAQARKLGVDDKLIDMFATTPETGRKLVERDGAAKARSVFPTVTREDQNDE